MLDDVVLNGKVIIRGLGEECRSNVKGGVNLCWEWVEVILGVEVKVDPVVAEGFQVGLATRCGAALRIRGSHVGGIFAYDVGDCPLILHHLLHTLVVCDIRQTVVRPGVRSDLVAFGDHAIDEGWVWSSGVNCTFAEIIARHEERGLEAVQLQEIQELSRVQIRSVIVCQRYHVCFGAIVYIVSVGNTS